jgi:hypothetical protein
MTTSRQLDREEIARRGQEIYEKAVAPTLRAEDDNKFVAIDVESADFVVHQDDRQAADLLWAQRPNAQIWLMRVGHPAAYRLSWRSTFGTTP